MFWRLLTLAVTVFWLVMATLLIRVTYYPEDSQFARLRPTDVFKTFLAHGNTLNALHIYHGDKKIGHASLTPRRLSLNDGQNDYMLLISGMLDKGAFETLPGQASWHMSLKLRDGDRWGGASGQFRLPDEGTIFDFTWEQDARLPAFTLRKHGEVLADSATLQMLQGPWSQAPGSAPQPSSSEDESIKVGAREGVIKIAGQQRKGFVMEFTFMERYRVRAFFTEAGELALVELPEGYRAIEPVIYGLVPDEPDDAPL